MKKTESKGYPDRRVRRRMELRGRLLTLMDVTSPQRKYGLLDMFDALRWIARVSTPWRMLPNDCPPWELVYQQTKRWLPAGCFEEWFSTCAREYV